MSNLEYKGEHNGVTYEQSKFKGTWRIQFKNFKAYISEAMSEEEVKQYIDVMKKADEILNR